MAIAESHRLDIDLGAIEPYDAAGVPAYTGDHADIYENIDRDIDAHVEELQRWLRQPSISAQNVGVADMAELLRSDLEALGFAETAIVPTDGHPGVWGFFDAGAPKTLMVYMMYDVQPVDPEDWRVPPFDAQIVDHDLGRVVMARGATNQKGPQRALLNAVASTIAATGTLPVNIMLTAEGEEELGSPHYPQVIDPYEDRLRTCAGVLFPFNSQNATGLVSLPLGVKGIVYVELECSGSPERGGPTRSEVHGSLKAIVDSPVLRLVQALASLTTPDGNTITVPGYYDAIREPTDEELRLTAGALPNFIASQEVFKQTIAVDRWIDDLPPERAILRSVFETTMNIDGIWAGYTGPGTKTILPHMATAKVDSRLVPNQRPEVAIRLVREHLDAQGFDDIVIRELGSYPPAQTSVEAPLVRAAIGVLNKRGLRPSVSPRLAGSAPFYQFTERLGLPLVPCGLGHGSGAHAPDEYMVIEPAEGSTIAGLADVEKAYVDFLFAFAGADR